MHDVNMNNGNAKDPGLWDSIKKFCNEFFNRYYKYIIVSYYIDTVDKNGKSTRKRVDSAFEKMYNKTVRHAYEEIYEPFDYQLKKNMKRINQYVKIIKNILSKASKSLPFLKNIAIFFYIKYIIAALEYNEIFFIENNENYNSNTQWYVRLCFGKFILDLFIHCSLVMGCFNFYFFIVPFPPHGTYILMQFLTLIHLKEHYDLIKIFVIFGWLQVLYGIFVSVLYDSGILTDKKIVAEWSELEKRSLYSFIEIIMTVLVLNYIVIPCVSMISSVPIIYAFTQSIYSCVAWLISDTACLGCLIILQGTSHYYFNIIATVIAEIFVQPFKIIFSMLADIPPTNIFTTILSGVIDIADNIIRVVLFLLFGSNYSGLKDNTKESGLEILYYMIVNIIEMMENIFSWCRNNAHDPYHKDTPVPAYSFADDNTDKRMPVTPNAIASPLNLFEKNIGTTTPTSKSIGSSSSNQGSDVDDNVSTENDDGLRP